MIRPGRNDRCPCGSGKKFKQCCLNSPAKPTPPPLSSADTWHRQGCAHEEAGRSLEAVVCYRSALAADPRHLRTLVNLGTLLKQLRRWEEAESCYMRALEIAPDFAEIHMNLGNVRKALQRHDDAVLCYQRALQLNPDLADAHYNLGSTLADLGRLRESLASLHTALRLQPHFPEVLHALGHALKLQGDGEASLAALRQGLSLAPEFSLLHSDLLMVMHYTPSQSSADIFAEACAYGKRFPARAARKPAAGKTGPVRVGFVSGDLRNHPVGYFTESVFKALDPTACTLYAYHTTREEDALSVRIKPLFREWRTIGHLDTASAADLIRRDHLDLLIDLGGHTDGGRNLPICAHRPAPVQATWLGYANTTGLPAMDYIIADPVTLPEQEADRYTEQVVRLPETYLCFTPPTEDVPVTPPPVLVNGYVTFGNFSNPIKINEAVIRCWGELLRNMPTARLMLKHEAFGATDEQDRYISLFNHLGVNRERVIFSGKSPRQEYLAAYGAVDCILDTFPFPGGTTTGEALWMGVPTLTLAQSRGMYGHHGELFMKTVGLDDWVAYAETEYLARAHHLCTTPDSLVHLRSQLRSRFLTSPLCDADRFARHLLEAFRRITNRDH